MDIFNSITAEHAIIALLVVGCVVLASHLIYRALYYRYLYSEVESTKGVVTDMDYTPPRTSTTVGPKGQVSTRTTPAKHEVFIACKDPKMEIHENDEELYQTVRLDDEVTIHYQRKYFYHKKRPTNVEFRSYRIRSVVSPKGREVKISNVAEATYDEHLRQYPANPVVRASNYKVGGN